MRTDHARDLHSFPTRRSSDLCPRRAPAPPPGRVRGRARTGPGRSRARARARPGRRRPGRGRRSLPPRSGRRPRARTRSRRRSPAPPRCRRAGPPAGRHATRRPCPRGCPVRCRVPCAAPSVQAAVPAIATIRGRLAASRLFAMPATPKVGFVSLGCPKALVDSERILTQLRVEGYELVPSYEAADVVVVNTCGFIDSAVAESLDAIGEAMAENGKVIVTGCLGKREEVIRQAHPGVLSISGPQDYGSVMQAVHAAVPPRHDPFVDLLPDYGLKLTPKHYAYLKISEGCNHRCSFCIIPSMRGDLASRPVDEVLREAERLVAGGVKELLVVSQDTSAYGVDLKYAPREWRGVQYETRMKA